MSLTPPLSSRIVESSAPPPHPGAGYTVMFGGLSNPNPGLVTTPPTTSPKSLITGIAYGVGLLGS